MKSFLTLIAILFISASASAQDPVKKSGGLFEKASSLLNKNSSSDLSSNEIVAGLKEALVLGAEKSGQKLSSPNGFFKDAAVKILMPKEVQAIEKKMRLIGMGKLVDNVPASMENLFRKSVQPYLISLLKYTPDIEIKKVRCPILIVQGSCDIQITLVDANRLHDANKKSRLNIIPGMTHTLKDAGENCADQTKTYSDKSLPLDPHLVKDISGFIQRN